MKSFKWLSYIWTHKGVSYWGMSNNGMSCHGTPTMSWSGMSDSCPGLSTGTGLVSGSITFPVIPIPVPVPTPVPEPIDCPTQEPDPEQDPIDMLQFFDSKISGKFQNEFFFGKMWQSKKFAKEYQSILTILYCTIELPMLTWKKNYALRLCSSITFFEKMITRTKSTFLQKVTSNGRFFRVFNYFADLMKTVA